MLEEKTEKYWIHFPDLIEYAFIYLSLQKSSKCTILHVYLIQSFFLSSPSDNDANGLVTG